MIFFVMGDINIDLLKIEKNENSRNYANSLIVPRVNA